MSTPSIDPQEFARRREKLRTRLKKQVGVIFAGSHDPHSDCPYRPHPHFEYLTGVTDEPDAILVLDPTHEVEARRDALLLRPLNPEVEKWDGYRLEVGSALRERTGFRTIYRTSMLGRILLAAARRSRSLACLHPLAPYDQPVSPDLALCRKVAERVPGVQIADRTELLAELRAVKSRAEVAQIQHAVDITAEAFDTMFTFMKPGVNEYAVQETIEHVYRSNGSRHTAFKTIVGAGVNSTVLHYTANNQQVADGDLVCIDSGAVWNGYSADVTRTVPANGTFTKRQREIYEIVLHALEASIEEIKAGVTLARIDMVAREIINQAGYGDRFIHSIGHHLGIETHDITPDGPLKAGAVVTIEPGIYIPEEKIGVRIEDDILVTRTGYKNLSAAIPKSVSAIEKAMHRT